MSAAASHPLTVGDLSFRLEADTGMIRTLRFRGHEFLRGIYPAVRGTHWETLPARASAPLIQHSGSHLRIQLEARVVSADVDFAWSVVVEAEASGTVRYQWRGRTHRDFLTNRTGLCLLHPAEAAGAACTVEHVDGTTTEGNFPVAISPHQPFKNIRATTHRFAPGAEATVRCTGEVFEMEDQRNWTDASFKTYCRRLDWPAPYSLPAETVIEHTVTISVSARDLPSLATNSHATRDTSSASLFAAAPASLRMPRKLPQIGFGLRSPLPASLHDRARRLRPSHVRVETTHATLAATLVWAIPEALALDCELDLAVLAATDAAPSPALFPSRCTVSLFDPAGNPARSSVLAAWQRAGFEALGTGTIHHFAELNRAHPPLSDPHQFTTFGINAQVHAFDDTSLFETLSQHAVVARQAAAIGHGRPVCIAPIVLGPGRDAADPRLHTDIGARWTLGSLNALAGATGVQRVTYFQLHGPDGILRENEPPTPLETLFATRFDPVAASVPALA